MIHSRQGWTRCNVLCIAFQVVFQGPRARMGIYEGIPTKVTPHSTTGRPDYFGPLVNRCSCKSGCTAYLQRNAAHTWAGQV